MSIVVGSGTLTLAEVTVPVLMLSNPVLIALPLTVVQRRDVIGSLATIPRNPMVVGS